MAVITVTVPFWKIMPILQNVPAAPKRTESSGDSKLKMFLHLGFKPTSKWRLGFWINDDKKKKKEIKTAPSGLMSYLNHQNEAGRGASDMDAVMKHV